MDFAPFEPRLRALAALILERNAVMNLTGDREPELFWVRQIEDALGAAAALATAWPVPPATVLDVGAGAGMPGLVWATLWPEARVTLLDSRHKRCEFLREAAGALDLPNVNVLCGRAEVLGQQATWREQFELVTARALAALPVLAELTLPFARVGGAVAALKSAAELDGEWSAAQGALSVLGSAPADCRTLPYTRGDAKACAVCWLPKRTPTPASYPRREGIPAKSPLRG